MNKKYLGDGVYVSHDGYHLILTTENGVSITNTIFLEPQVLGALERYIEALTRTTPQPGEGEISHIDGCSCQDCAEWREEQAAFLETKDEV